MHLPEIPQQSLTTNKCKPRGIPLDKNTDIIRVANGATSCDIPIMNLTQPSKVSRIPHDYT